MDVMDEKYQKIIEDCDRDICYYKGIDFQILAQKITILRETIAELVEKLKAASLKDEQSAADDKNPTT
jgi:hypothetical protein